MKKFLSVLLCACLPFLCCCGCAQNQTVFLNFPTATTSGAIYSIGAAFANVWNENMKGVVVSAQASNGGVQNLGLLASGEAQLGVAVTSIITQQKQGAAPFEGKAYDGVRVITALYQNYNQVVVDKKTGAESLADLAGLHFAPGAAGATTEVETGIHLEAAGMRYPEDIDAEFVGFTEAVDLMRNKQLDGAWIQSGIPTSAVTEMLKTANGKLISIDEEVIERLRAEYPWYNRAVIPAGTYEGQDEDVVTTGLTITLVTDARVDEETVYQMTKLLWENMDELSDSYAPLKGLSAEQAVENLAGLPLHPGAERYYKEIGVL